MRELTDAQRAEVREHVALERQRTAARMVALQRDFDDIVSASAEAVRDDEHDPEGATIAFERAQVAALLADARTQLAALDATAERLARGDGGRCTRCGRPIGFERLMARPASGTCITCARAA